MQYRFIYCNIFHNRNFLVCNECVIHYDTTSSRTIGSLMTNVVPLFNWLSAVIVPSWASIIHFTMDSPKPVP